MSRTSNSLIASMIAMYGMLSSKYSVSDITPFGYRQKNEPRFNRKFYNAMNGRQSKKRKKR